MFCILIRMLTQMHAFVKAYKTANLKYIHFTMYVPLPESSLENV